MRFEKGEAMIPKDFPWRPGMLARINNALYRIDDDMIPRNRYGVEFEVQSQDWVADDATMTDPATVGAILGAVREAWRSPHAYVRRNGTIRTDDNRIVPAWEVCDLYLDDEGARAIGASRRGSVNCALLLSEFDALLAAWNARPVKA
jgi:hypothetical protein